MGPVHVREAGLDKQQDQADVEDRQGADDRVIAQPDLGGARHVRDQATLADRDREEDQGRQGDDDLGDDQADVGQRVERQTEPLGCPLDPERGHRSDDRRHDRGGEADDHAVDQVALDLLAAQDELVPVQAEPRPVRHPRARVEAEDDDHEDRQVEEPVDEPRVAAQPELDDDPRPIPRGTPPAGQLAGRDQWSGGCGCGHRRVQSLTACSLRGRAARG